MVVIIQRNCPMLNLDLCTFACLFMTLLDCYVGAMVYRWQGFMNGCYPSHIDTQASQAFVTRLCLKGRDKVSSQGSSQVFVTRIHHKGLSQASRCISSLHLTAGVRSARLPISTSDFSVFGYLLEWNI